MASKRTLEQARAESRKIYETQKKALEQKAKKIKAWYDEHVKK